MSEEKKKRDKLSLKQVRAFPGAPALSLDFRPGMHALVTSRQHFAQALLECMAGLRSTKGSFFRGPRIRLGKESPENSPRLRARLGLLLADEPPLPGGPSVRDSLARLLEMRSSEESEELLRPESLPLCSGLLDRSSSSLSAEERRRVSLALALSFRKPRALFLYHPLRHLNAEDADTVLDRLRHHADAETIIVCVTPNRAEAERLSPRIQQLGSRTRRSHDENYYSISCSKVEALKSHLENSDWVSEVHHPPYPGLRLIFALDEKALNEASEGPAKLGQLLADAPGTLFQVEAISASAFESQARLWETPLKEQEPPSESSTQRNGSEPSESQKQEGEPSSP